MLENMNLIYQFVLSDILHVNLIKAAKTHFNYFSSANTFHLM